MKTVSLFSGCGGLDLGFSCEGYDIVWANDFDKDAQMTYGSNIGDIDPRDITTIKNKEIPNCDIVLGGFPCQPFSSAGNRGGLDDHRGNLFLECVRVVQNKKPLAFVFENVRGILSIKNKNGEKLIDSLKKTFLNLKNTPGYECCYKLVKAHDYQVPQQRYRVFIVGIRKDLGVTFEFPDAVRGKKLEVKYIINELRNLKNQDDVWHLSPQARHMISFIPEGGSWKDVPYEQLPPRFRKIRDNMKYYRAPNFYRRFSRDEINGTITASAQPENCGILHPLEDRRYSVREVARIQSFPDNFEFFANSVPGMYKIIGNAVPPNLARHISKRLKDILERKYVPEVKPEQIDIFNNLLVN